jgi:hypothetical protein
LLHNGLLLSQVLLLSSHQVLFFLLASLERILLLGCQGSAKAWETTREGWLSRSSGSVSPLGNSRFWAVRKANLGHKERLA